MAMTLFNVAVKAVIENEGKILLLHGGKSRDFWQCPGGRIDGNETIQEALHREIAEELPSAANVTIHEILHAERLPGMALDDRGILFIWYRVTADFPDGIVLSDEHDSYQWCGKKEVAEIASFGVADAVRKL